MMSVMRELKNEAAAAAVASKSEESRRHIHGHPQKNGGDVDAGDDKRQRSTYFIESE